MQNCLNINVSYVGDEIICAKIINRSITISSEISSEFMPVAEKIIVGQTDIITSSGNRATGTMLHLSNSRI